MIPSEVSVIVDKFDSFISDTIRVLFEFSRSIPKDSEVFSTARSKITAATKNILRWKDIFAEKASSCATLKAIDELNHLLDTVSGLVRETINETQYFIWKCVYDEATTSQLLATRRWLNLEGLTNMTPVVEEAIKYYRNHSIEMNEWRKRLSKGSLPGIDELDQFLSSVEVFTQSEAKIVEFVEKETGKIGVLHHLDEDLYSELKEIISQSSFPEFKHSSDEVSREVIREDYAKALSYVATFQAQLKEQCLEEFGNIFKDDDPSYLMELINTVDDELKELDKLIEELSNQLVDIYGDEMNFEDYANRNVHSRVRSVSEQCRKSLQDALATQLSNYYTAFLKEMIKLDHVFGRWMAKAADSSNATQKVKEVKNYLQDKKSHLEKVVAQICDGNLVLITDIHDLRNYLKTTEDELRQI